MLSGIPTRTRRLTSTGSGGRSRRTLLLVSAVLAAMLPALASAQLSPAQEKPPLPRNPADLVRLAVDQQLSSRDKRPLLTWKERIQKPSRTLTKQLVDTPDG